MVSPFALTMTALPRVLFAGKFSHSQRVPFHRHEGSELVLVTAGSCQVEVGDVNLIAPRGSVLVLPAEKDHNQINDGIVSTTYVVFHAPKFAFNNRPRVLLPDPHDPFASWLSDVHSLYHQSHSNSDVALGGLMLACLERLNAIDHRHADVRALPKPLVIATRFIEHHLLDRLVVAEVAATARICPSHLGTLFRTHYGCGPLAYQQRLRLALACKLLHNSYLSVTEVAAACGYSDVNYFIRLFKSTHRLTPQRWRRQRLENVAR